MSAISKQETLHESNTSRILDIERHLAGMTVRVECCGKMQGELKEHLLRIEENMPSKPLQERIIGEVIKFNRWRFMMTGGLLVTMIFIGWILAWWIKVNGNGNG